MLRVWVHGCEPGRVSDGSRLALCQTLSIECPSSIFFWHVYFVILVLSLCRFCLCFSFALINSRLRELRIDYLIEDGRGPQWRPESAETFIFRNTLWPSGRFLRGIFSKNYLGWRGTKISLKISSGAQSENLEPSLTIQEFFSKKYSWFLCSVCVPFLGS